MEQLQQLVTSSLVLSIHGNPAQHTMLNRCYSAKISQQFHGERPINYIHCYRYNQECITLSKLLLDTKSLRSTWEVHGKSASEQVYYGTQYTSPATYLVLYLYSIPLSSNCIVQSSLEGKVYACTLDLNEFCRCPCDLEALNHLYIQYPRYTLGILNQCFWASI